MPLRSARWFQRDDDVGLEHRAALRAAGVDMRTGDDRPVIGVLNSASDINPCNMPLRALAVAVKQGVQAAGGIALEIPTISLGEDLMKPTTMLYRNLMAIEIEETIRAYPLDGVVLLGNCDKTIPAQLMGAASADVPSIALAGGYRRPGNFRGAEVGAGTDLWKFWDERRAGRLGDADWQQLEAALGCTQGACNVMGTAMTMAILTEALGLMLPGAGTLPFDDNRLTTAAVETGHRAVELVRADVRPSAVLTRAAFSNALVVLAATGGSTNAIVHLCAIAGRRAITLDLADFDAAARAVPVLVDVAPVGRGHIADYDAAGGTPALLVELAEHLDRDVVTVNDGAPTRQPPHGWAIRPLIAPVSPAAGLAVLRGSLAPDGAVMKTAAASSRLLEHTGPAVVFDGYGDMLARVDDPNLDVTSESVLVLRGCGPRGGDGFPEWGMIPIPKKLAREGVTDLVRISDARMSGTSYGTCILHVAPEAAVGGPLALVRDGDLVHLDVARRQLDLLLDGDERARRQTAWAPTPSRHLRGWPALFDRHVMQAPDGADFDFLRPAGPQELTFIEPVVGRS